MRKIFILIFLLPFLNGCVLFGLHKKVHNPKHAGKYVLTEDRKLLGTITHYRNCYDVKYYDLSVKFDIEKKSINGKVEMISVATSNFDTLQVDLWPEMKMNSISYNGSNLKFYRKYKSLFVVMPSAVKKGEKFSIEMDYEGVPHVAKKAPWDGGFVWKKDKQENPWIGVACETEGASLWWPNKDENSDEPDSASMHFTVPENLVAVSNGMLESVDENKSEKLKTYNWFTHYSINNYNITFYIGNFQLLQDTFSSKVSGKKLALNYWVLPENYEKAKTHFRQVHTTLDFYEKNFGEYPWYRDSYKLIESPYEGMEHQSAIAYGHGYKTDFRGFDYIILHETAHEWWGNSVSASDLADVWIHEGFASFCEAMYVEQTKGKEAYYQYLYWQRIFIKNERPFVGPVGYKYFSYKDEDCYNKGSLTLSTFRNMLGNDSLFFGILKTFRINNNMKTVSSRDFINLVNEKTGKDYSWFFNQYLYRREAPELEYLVREGKLFFRWSKTNPDFVMPVKFKFDDGTEITVHPTNKISFVSLNPNLKTMMLPAFDVFIAIKQNKKLYIQ